MILVDTSVWVTADRLPSSPEAVELRSLLTRDEVATTDVVIAEVLQGAPSLDSFRELADKLQGVHLLHADAEVWLEAAELSFHLRRSGLATALSDLLIATVALRAGIPVFTSDNDFSRVDGLELYQPQTQ